MKRIIKPGRIESETYIVECPECGCVFETDEVWSKRNLISSICPECGSLVLIE